MAKNLIKEKFNYDVSALPNYVDQEKDQLLVKQVTEAPSLAYLNVQTGIKGTEALKIMDSSIVYQDGTCGMTPATGAAFTNRNITVHPIGYMKPFCNEDLVGKWTQNVLRPGMQAQNGQMPFEEAFVAHVTNLNSFEVEKLIWRGDRDAGSGNLAYANGFIKNVTVAGGAVDLGSDTITTTNAFNKFREKYAAMPIEITEAEDFTFFVGREHFLALINNMIDLNLFHFDPTEMMNRGDFSFPTIGRVVRVTGLSGTGKIFAGKASEFIVGTDLESDFDDLNIFYDEKDDKIYARAKFRLGTQVPFPGQIGLWSPGAVPAPSPSSPSSPSASPSA
jgi:hypothetical protein